MQYYPLFLNLHHLHIALVGAGVVGTRKLASVLSASPKHVFVIDPVLAQPHEVKRIQAMNINGYTRLNLLAEKFHPDSIPEEVSLVFSATEKPLVNKAVALFCQTRGILCNIADAEEESSFIVPASIHQGDITLSVVTGGKSPALTRRIREDLEEWLGKRYSTLAIVMGRLRPLVLALGQPSANNTALFRTLVASPLMDYLEKENITAARELLYTLLPPSLHEYIGDLLHEL